MHAYLIAGTGDKQSETDTLLVKLSARAVPFPAQTIADIRQIGAFTKLRPSEPTAVVVTNFDAAGKDAQNAFLKSLEEAGDGLYFILTCTKLSGVLPTISSRCQILTVHQPNVESAEIAKDFLAKSPGARLAQMDAIKGREEAVEFVDTLTKSLHTLLTTTKSDHAQIARAAEGAGVTLTRLKANGNVTIQLANLAVNI